MTRDQRALLHAVFNIAALVFACVMLALQFGPWLALGVCALVCYLKPMEREP